MKFVKGEEGDFFYVHADAECRDGDGYDHVPVNYEFMSWDIFLRSPSSCSRIETTFWGSGVLDLLTPTKNAGEDTQVDIDADYSGHHAQLKSPY